MSEFLPLLERHRYNQGSLSQAGFETEDSNPIPLPPVHEAVWQPHQITKLTKLSPLPEMRGHPIVGIAKMFHNSFNWMCTFSMGINQNNKLPNFRSSRLL